MEERRDKKSEVPVNRAANGTPLGGSHFKVYQLSFIAQQFLRLNTKTRFFWDNSLKVVYNT